MRDPLVLKFLNLKDEYSETDLEDALVHHLEAFLLELGGDFTFVGPRRRFQSRQNTSRQILDLRTIIAPCPNLPLQLG